MSSTKTHSQIDIRALDDDVAQPFIRLYAHGAFVRNYKIESGNTLVGRDYGCGIVLNDPFLSRRHFMLEYDGAHRLYAQDLESRNGTYVNGQKISRIALGHGDRLGFGVYEFVISFPARADNNVVPFPNVVTEPLRPMISDADLAKEAPAKKPPGSDIPETLPMHEVSKRLPKPLLSTKEARVYQRYPLPPLKGVLLRIQAFAPHVAAAAVSLTLAWQGYPWISRMLQKSTQAVETASVDGAQETEMPGNPKGPSVPKGRGKSVMKGDAAQGPSKSQRSGQDSSVRPSAPRSHEVPEKKSSAAQRGRSQANEKMVAQMHKTLGSVLDQGDLSGVGNNLTGTKTGDDRLAMNMKGQSAKLEPIDIDHEVEMPEQKRGLNAKSFPTGSAVEMVDARKYSSHLRDKLAVAQHCYVDHVGSAAKRGQVTVSFSIKRRNGIGKARNVRIRRSTLQSKAVQDCIVDEIQGVDFADPPWDNYETTYTFHFGQSKKVDFS